MKKSTLYTSRILLAAGLAVTFGAAQAAPITFDFGATAVGNEQGNPAESDGAPVGLRFDGTTGNVFTDGFSGTGLQVIATGQNQSGTDDPFAYLDSPEEGRNAGLGVCQTLGGTQCDPSSDDNVTGNPNFDEQLTLTFNSLVELSGLTFKGEEHFGVDATPSDGSAMLNGTNTLLVDGGEMTFADAELATLIGSQFTFGFGTSNPEQFYLSAATAEAQEQDVPVPAGIGLLGFGLLGLGAAIRRRRNIG